MGFILKVAVLVLLGLVAMLGYIWFKNRKYHKELEHYLAGVANNAANNYKDAAQQAFKEFADKLEELKNANALNSEQLTYYQDMKNKYENELKGFHH